MERNRYCLVVVDFCDCYNDDCNLGEIIMSKEYKLKLTENDIKNQVKDYLSLKKWFHFHVLQGLGAYKGVSDRIAIKDGRVIFLECKKPGGKQSAEQIEFQANVENVGGEYYVIHSLEEIMEICQ